MWAFGIAETEKQKSVPSWSCSRLLFWHFIMCGGGGWFDLMQQAMHPVDFSNQVD